MSLTVLDFDDVFLRGKAIMDKWLVDYNRQMFEPIAMLAITQQIRQLPAPVQAEMKRQSPQAWQRLFGDKL